MLRKLKIFLTKNFKQLKSTFNDQADKDLY